MARRTEAREAPRDLPPLDVVLPRFRGTLAEFEAQHPHLSAYQLLRADDPQLGEPLNRQAAQLFEALRDAGPDDAVTAHHLAILYHGAAYQNHLDGRGDSAETIALWRKGLDAWAEVLNSDALWQCLQHRWRQVLADGKQDLFLELLLKVDWDAFRAQMPAHLLQLHAAIVAQTMDHRQPVAQAHLQLIASSPFDATLNDRVRRSVFTSQTRGVDELCKEARFDRAYRLVDRYLAADPDYPPALRMALAICTEECRRMPDDEDHADQAIALCRRQQSKAEHPALLAAVETDQFTADYLRDFYIHWGRALFRKGDAFVKRDPAECVRRLRQAQEKARLAVAFERGGQSARQLMSLIAVSGAFAQLIFGDDFALLDEILQMGLDAVPQDPSLRALRAAWYLDRDDLDNFRAELDRARQLNNATPNDMAGHLLGELESGQTKGRVVLEVYRLKRRINGALGSQRTREAERHVGRMEALKSQLDRPDLCWLYCIKGVCELSKGSRHAALASIATARRYVGPDTDPEIRQMLEQLGPY